MARSGHALVYFDPDGTAWMDRAACAGSGVDLFFPGRGDNAAAVHAREVCARCPVRGECLDYALRNGEYFGVWGGLTEQERRRLRRARAATRA